MCKKRFQSNSMKGYPLEDLYDTLGEIKVIESVLVPTVDEEPLMARLMDGEPDYENEEGFPQKKDKRKVHEEASSSNTSLEDVEKMNKRLGKIERCQVVLKKRCKRMKAMEKKLEKIEDCQYYLKKKAKKAEKEMKEMKEKEEDKENNDGFDYQGMDYDWGGQRNDSNGADATTKEPEDADMVENTEVVEEKESEEDAQKDDRGSEEETEPEPEAEAEAEEDKEKEDEEESEEEAPKEPDEVQDEVEMNEANEIEEEVETEAWVEVETEKTPTPPRGRTKAAAARRQILTTPEKLFGKAEKMVEEEVKEPEEEGEKMVEEEVEEPEEEGEKMVEEEEEAGKMVVYEGSTCETKEADKGAAKPSGTGVKHRPKQMALRKHATKQAPKPRGRPRKDAEPKKFTTPEQTKRIRSRSQWVSTPFTEANTDEIEGRKKKPRTKA
uniref:DUF287 domain-containing protein n=1 Tax=Brassica oleracea TaxID=3712 RepID=A0A3P6DZW3_BRAOL|nr:unnamed protein product [Brassica oleracea]